jgi:AraC-like DNA-binding protein
VAGVASEGVGDRLVALLAERGELQETRLGGRQHPGVVERHVGGEAGRLDLGGGDLSGKLGLARGECRPTLLPAERTDLAADQVECHAVLLSAAGIEFHRQPGGHPRHQHGLQASKHKRAKSKMPRPATTRKRQELLRDARAYVKRTYRDPDLSLKGVAEAVGASSRQLQRVFREEGGEEFRAYVLRVRMERATKLLSERAMPVYHVARHVGYRQASGLRQAFVRYYGYNPSAIQPETPEYLGDIEFGPEG